MKSETILQGERGGGVASRRILKFVRNVGTSETLLSLSRGKSSVFKGREIELSAVLLIPDTAGISAVARERAGRCLVT